MLPPSADAKAILDHRGLRVHAHDLVRLRLVTSHRVQTLLNQFVDQLRNQCGMCVTSINITSLTS